VEIAFSNMCSQWSQEYEKNLVLVLVAASNKSATWSPLPPPGCGEGEKKTGRKLVGRDKGSLTEQQAKGTVTTTIQRRKHDTNRTTHRAVLPDRTGARAPELRVSSSCPAPLPPSPARGTRYGIPGSVWPGGVGSARPAVPLPGFW